MRLWPRNRRRDPVRDAALDDALWEADRALRDAKQLRSRADDVGDRLAETRRRNHIAAAVIQSIRGA